MKRIMFNPALALACVAALVNGCASGNDHVAEKPPRLEPGQSLGKALGIASIPNLRDVGGYKTRDGSTVVRGIAYRSDTFNPMTPGDLQAIGKLGLKQDYDLRTTAEVKAKPDILPSGVN